MMKIIGHFPFKSINKDSPRVWGTIWSNHILCRTDNFLACPFPTLGNPQSVVICRDPAYGRQKLRSVLPDGEVDEDSCVPKAWEGAAHLPNPAAVALLYVLQTWLGSDLGWRRYHFCNL